MRNKVIVSLLVLGTILVGTSVFLLTRGSVAPQGDITITPTITLTPILRSTKTQFTDKEILDAVYSYYKVPEGFFTDNIVNNGKVTETINYVRVLKNGSWEFYCTNDFNTAKQMTVDFIKDNKFIENRENEKFYEFKTSMESSSSEKQYFIHHRVHKCSYLSDLKFPGLYDKNAPLVNKYIGKYDMKPVTKENVKELVEYIWYSLSNNFEISGTKVLSSDTEDSGDSVKHTLIEILTVGGDWNMCDDISLIKSIYSVDKSSGEISLTQENLGNLKGACH